MNKDVILSTQLHKVYNASNKGRFQRIVKVLLPDPIKQNMSEDFRRDINHAVEDLSARNSDSKTGDKRDTCCSWKGHVVLVDVQIEEELDACCVDDGALDEEIA